MWPLFLILARQGGRDLALEEYRTTLSDTAPDLSSRYFLTSGFASSSMYLHPRYRAGAAFRHIGREAKGRRLQILAFAQKPETAELITSFHLVEGTAVILVQGLAWVDPESYQILRMRTDLLVPRPDIRLDRQTTEIEFGEVRFEQVARRLRLPRKVVVTVDWQQTVYRNQHSYSDFSLLADEMRKENKQPVLPKRGGETS